MIGLIIFSRKVNRIAGAVLLAFALQVDSFVCAADIEASTEHKPAVQIAARTNADSVPPPRGANFDAVKSLPRASSVELKGWKIIEHVCLESNLNSKQARVGDIVWGRLEDDCKFGVKLVAAHDSLIKGHVVAIEQPRTLLRATLSSTRRTKKDAAIGIVFDEIIDQDGRSWPVKGKLCRWSDLQANSSGGAPRLVQVDKNGNTVKAGPTLSETEKNAILAARIATYAPIPGHFAIGMVGVPLAMGIAGAARPSFVFKKPVNTHEKGIRAKGFAYGFVTNLPGAVVVLACVKKGEQVDLKAGDKVAVDLTFGDSSCIAGQSTGNIGPSM